MKKIQSEKKIIMKKILFLLFKLFLGVTGIALIWIFGCWQLALGVFLTIWGNNYTIMDNIKKELNTLLLTMLKDLNEKN